jgi:hypothetical protein
VTDLKQSREGKLGTYKEKGVHGLEGVLMIGEGTHCRGRLIWLGRAGTARKGCS